MNSRQYAIEYIKQWAWRYGLAVKVEDWNDPIVPGIRVQFRVCLGELAAQTEYILMEHDLNEGSITYRLMGMAMKLGIYIAR